MSSVPKGGGIAKQRRVLNLRLLQAQLTRKIKGRHANNAAAVRSAQNFSSEGVDRQRKETRTLDCCPARRLTRLFQPRPQSWIETKWFCFD